MELQIVWLTIRFAYLSSGFSCTMKWGSTNRRLNTNIKLILTWLSRSPYLEPFNKIRSVVNSFFFFYWIDSFPSDAYRHRHGAIETIFSSSGSLSYNHLDFQKQLEVARSPPVWKEVWFGSESLLVELILCQWSSVQHVALRPSSESFIVQLCFEKSNRPS